MSYDVGRTVQDGKSGAWNQDGLNSRTPGIYIPDNESMSDVPRTLARHRSRNRRRTFLSLMKEHVLSHKAPKTPDDIEI